MLQNSRGMSFSEGAEAPQVAATQPQSAWGTLKWTQIHKFHKMHAPKIQMCVCVCCCSSEGAEGLVSDESLNKYKIRKIHAPKFQFLLVWGSRSAAGSCNTGAKGCGSLKTFQNSKRWNRHRNSFRMTILISINRTYLTACVYLATTLL